MEVVILEKNNKIAKSLKRCISPRFQCSIENNFDIKALEQKYRGSNSIFLIDECIFDQNENEINREGLKLAHWIVDRLHLKAIVFGLEKKEKSPIPYLKAPFDLDELFEEISNASGSEVTEKVIEKDLLLDRYEHFRSKISHDYLQYAAKNMRFYKFLILNFNKYARLIFGIDLNEEKGIGQDAVKKALKGFEEQNDSSIIHDLMINLKLDQIKKSHPKDWPEIPERFFKNLNILMEVLIDAKEVPKDLEEKVAENFFLSWYLWRKLFFLEKYNQHFSDGFYKGCFRVLLSYDRSYYQKVKKNTFISIFNTSNIAESIEQIKSEIKRLKEIFI